MTASGKTEEREKGGEGRREGRGEERKEWERGGEKGGREEKRKEGKGRRDTERVKCVGWVWREEETVQ